MTGPSPTRGDLAAPSTAAGERPAAGPIFIGGLDRSGKTTMRAFLASHPNIAIPAVGSNMETYFYGRFGDLARPENLDRCLEAMLRYKHVRFLAPDPDRIRREFRLGPRTYPRLFSLLLIHYAERVGKPRWGAQTGLIERYADVLFEAYPGVKLIHMVRDPRDRYEASLALWPDGRGRAGGATARWRYSIGLAERNRRRYAGSYAIVRFEDLVTAPERTVRELCGFLGETYHPEMLAMPGAPTHRDRLQEADPSPNGTPLSSAFIGGFRGKVAPAEVAFIQLHAGRKMRTFGYPPEPSGLTGSDRVRFVAIDWPSQAGRMLAWRTIEELQQRFPRVVPRVPSAKMLVDPPVEEAP